MAETKILRTNRVPTIDQYKVDNVNKAMKSGYSLLEHVDNILTSKTALISAQAAARSLPYVLDVPKFNGWYEAATTRISYLEAAFMSVVSMVFNFFAAVGSTLLAGATLGQVDAFKSAFKKYWSNTALGAMSTGMSVVGIVSPKYALYFGALNGALIGSFLSNRFEDVSKDIGNLQFMEVIQAMYENFYPQIEEYMYSTAGSKDSAARELEKLDELVGNLQAELSEFAEKGFGSLFS